ncbi:SLBB domain-containing protein [Alloacidobacterium dinghuense]|uniref:SLBB domain-containing protein n=1 Tax=Alloacidobacterium dinghuense TaxID=2763107 RepID=A0A7G8BDY7_9BACT|nr:polysaccharide biosynthesis/export family protein [Alloacidobacterium dinghuense]QNI30757.1 SLBB domain-containing protein [Alloacidobacterium dinghuense]
MRLFKFCTYVLLAGVLATVSHRSWAQVNSVNDSQPTKVADQSAIIIGPGDLLDLTVFDVPELILKVRVDSTGIVNLPLIGDLKFAGMTVREAQLLIARKLVELEMVKKPEVSLLIEEFATQGTTVSGEVNAPGIYPLMGPHRLFDAISAAGGLTVKAGRAVTIIHAGQKDHPEIITLPEGTSFEQANVTIYPGDTIVISKTGVVYVVGEVAKPGAFLMENNTSMSFLKAIALAQGTTKLASQKHTLILRKTSTGTLQYEVPLNKIYQGEAPDLQLHAEDIVFVPTSNVKTYGAIGLQGAISAAIASIYVLR